MHARSEPPLASFLLRDTGVIEKDGLGRQGDTQSSLPQPVPAAEERGDILTELTATLHTAQDTSADKWPHLQEVGRM